MKKSNVELVGKNINILDTEFSINQLKLMRNGTDVYLTAVDDGGYLHTMMIKYSDKTFTGSQYKKFNCKIDASDNSTWSLDCSYPFVAVGGNHRCIVISNINDETEGEIKNNIVLDGNNHNIPCVSFSPDGELIGCSSIDSIPKIYDMHYQTITKRIDNRTKDWGWGIKFVKRDLFSIIEQADESFMEDINYHPFVKTITDGLKLNLFRWFENIKDEDTQRINDSDIKQDIDYYKLYLNNCLQKYIYVSTYKNSAYITGYNLIDDKLKQVDYSKFNPLINYIKAKYKTMSNVTYATLIELKHYIEYSRYEYIFVSEATNKLILGNKQGDINVYDMILYHKDGNLVYCSKPIAIIDFNSRIAGLRLVDYKDDNNPDNYYFKIFVLGLNGFFECYKFKK